jgi:VCBS repeat protein/FG-GAP repeat protein
MATDFEIRLEEALKSHPGAAVEERLRAAALAALTEAEHARPKILALPAWIRRPGRPRRLRGRHRRTWVIALAALTATTGGALAARELLQGGERTAVLVDRSAAERLARSPALADAPWLQGAGGVAYIQEVAPRPSLVFPPGVSYPEALQRFYDAVSRHGTLPAGSRLGPPLPVGKIVAFPADSAHGVAIDLRAPFGYDNDTGAINTPGYDPTFASLARATLPLPGRGTPLPIGIRIGAPISGPPFGPGDPGNCGMALDLRAPTPACALPPPPPAVSGPLRGAPSYRLGATVIVDTPNQVAVADFNGDGRQDLALTSATAPILSVIIAPGTGHLSRPVRYRLSSVPSSIVAGRFSGGRGPDLAVAGVGGIAVLANRGDGRFSRPLRYALGRRERLTPTWGSLVGVDLAGDGHLDLVAWNRETGSLWSFLRRGKTLLRIRAGSALPLPQVSFVAAGAELAAADLTGDGRADLVLAAGTRVIVMAGDGRGHFHPRAPVHCDPLDPEAVHLADLNGDGRADLVVAGNVGVAVALGDGRGGFGPCQLVASLPGADTGGATVADLTGDHVPDLLVTDGATGPAPHPTGPVVRLYAGRGDGSFRLAATYPAGPRPQTVALLPRGVGRQPVLIVASSIESTVTVLVPSAARGSRP